MIHAWAQEQGDDSKHNFPDQDMMVPWRLQVILSLGCSVISVAFYYLCSYFSLLMPYWL
jgi:hypothetical protein